MKKSENPLVFPLTDPASKSEAENQSMTLLDYFAAKAMQAHITNPVYMNSISEIKNTKKAAECVCKDSYMVALNMLKQRQKHL